MSKRTKQVAPPVPSHDMGDLAERVSKLELAMQGQGGRKKKTGKTRASSAYNLFMQKKIPELKKQDPELTHQDAFKLAASVWGKAPENPKNVKGGKAKLPPKASAKASAKAAPKKKVPPPFDESSEESEEEIPPPRRKGKGRAPPPPPPDSDESEGDFSDLETSSDEE